MGKTSRHIHIHRIKSKRKMPLFFVLLLITIVGVSFGVNYRYGSHAADSISIELDGNTVDPSTHIQMTTSSITLTLRSTDNIYNDPTKYAINWTIESEEHQKRATIENGSSSIYGILTAKQPGEVQVMVNIVDKTSESLGIVASASCWVDIIFSVDTVHDDANFKYVYDDDTSRSLIMHTGDPVYQLGLAFGNAENCQWTSENDEVVTVDNSGRVTVVGAGRTGIVVTYTPPGDTQTYTARLPVYVFPKLSLDGSNYFTGGTYGMSSGDIIYTDAFFGPVNTETIQEKIVWVIKKDVNGVRTVIEDSLGNKQSDLIDISTFGGTSNTPNLVLNAKAGNYYIEFYPEGTYESESRKTSISPTVINLTVYAELGNLDKTILVKDAFNLAEAFNMTAGDFNNLFSLPVINLSGSGDASNYVSYASDTTIVTSKQKGTVIITVKAQSDKVDNVLNLANPSLGLTSTEFRITLRIIDSFTLDRTNVVMYKGQTLQLNPTFTSYSGVVTWTSSDSKTVSVSESGLLKALKETPIGTDVTVTATLELDDGTIKKATCVVRVESSIDKFSIDPSEVTVLKGDTVTLLAKFSGNVTVAPFTWKSTEPKVCTVLPASDAKSCLITAVNSGEATIVLTNTENGVQVYCKVTVPVDPIPISGISLKNKKIEAKMYTEGVKIAYTITPANATETELIWESSDESVAKVDNTGLVTFVGPGTSYVTVHPKVNPNQVFESCELKIIKTADSMALSTTAHTMYTGETFTLRYTIEPENSELKVVFSSADSNIATIDANTGLITAKKAGLTQIFAKGEGLNAPAVCSLTVLQKSNAIAFVDKEIIVQTGGTATAKVSLSPADSTDTVSWLSLDPKVATVVDGVVTGVASGSTYIQVKTESGKDAIVPVYVRDPVKGLALDKNELKLNVGEEYKLSTVFTPAEPYNKNVKWSTSNGGIATVDQNGKLKAESGGVAVIKCISDDGGFQAICIVTVIAPTPAPQPTKKPPVSFTLNYSSYKLGLGKKVTLKPVTVNVSGKPKYTWKSSNKKIATVSKNGKVTGKKLGTCKITVSMTYDGKKYNATCTIRVIRKITSIRLNRETASVLVGNTLKLSAIIKPAAATIKNVRWTSSDSQIASIDNKGNVLGVAPGIVKIKATAKDGSKKYGTCIVTVKEKVEANSITPPDSETVIAVGTAKSIGFKTSPDNSTDKIYYTTDNKSVVAITAKGKIYGRSVGSATVYATTSSGATASVDVKVVGLNRGTIVMRPYDTETLWVNGFDSGVKWYSENPLIASVVNGKVVGRKPGTTRIYAVVDGTKMSCSVKVTKLR